jgi:choloylglycine hydrolase
VVDLKEAMKAADGEIRTIEMEKSTQTATDVSAELKSMTQSSNE